MQDYGLLRTTKTARTVTHRSQRDTGSKCLPSRSLLHYTRRYNHRRQCKWGHHSIPCHLIRTEGWQTGKALKTPLNILYPMKVCLLRVLSVGSCSSLHPMRGSHWAMSLSAHSGLPEAKSKTGWIELQSWDIHSPLTEECVSCAHKGWAHHRWALFSGPAMTTVQVLYN